MDTGVLPKPIPFGKYCLLEKISVGGMAEVYKAKAFGVEGFERLLAVKKILNSIAEDETFISMFIDEAKIAGQLNHPNIAQIFDLGKVDGSYFIALEYVSGRDLRTVWDRFVRDASKPNVFLACHVVMKVAEALHYAHHKRDSSGQELNIVHRDISPHNVLLSYEGDVKIIDFGIAKAQGKSSQTQVGILKGKFSYMSPEQVRGLHIDHRADLFSLGIVLYELLTQERLFLGESDFDTLEKIRKVEMSPPTLYNPHIPRELEDIVLKALAKSPDDRFQTGVELVEALERFLRNQGSFFGTKDLSAVMKKTFAAEIELERKKLDYYRTINLDSLTGGASRGLGWGAEEVDTRVYGRSGGGMGPNGPGAPVVNFNSFDEISPAAEFGPPMRASSPGIPTFGTNGVYGGRAEPDIVYKSGERPSPAHMAHPHAAPLPGLVGVDDLVDELDEDDLDDPTMEFDRWQVGSALTPKIQEALPPSADPLEAVMRAPVPTPQPQPVPVLPAPPRTAEPSPFAAPPPPAPNPLHAQTIAPSLREDERRGRGGTIALIVIILVLVVGGGVGVFLFKDKLMGADAAAITFKISNAEAVEILIDKEPMHSGGAGAPVVLKDIKPGERQIEIRAEGYEPVMDTLTVESGQQYVLPIEMRKAPEVGKAAVSVKVDPADAVVTLNGEEVKDKAPFARRDLKPGKVEVVFKKDGFIEERREVELVEGKTADLDVRLRPSAVALTVKPEPADAEVTLFQKDSADATDKRKVKAVKGPLELKDLDARKVYEVEVTKKGFLPWVKDFEPGFEPTRTLLANLEPEEKEAPAVAGADNKALQEERRRRWEERIKSGGENPGGKTGGETPPVDTGGGNTGGSGTADPPIVVKVEPKEEGGTGVINVSSKPQAKVFVDGKDTGKYTPLLNFPVSAGAHRVTLRNDEQGLNTTYNVTVKAGGSQTILHLPKAAP